MPEETQPPATQEVALAKLSPDELVRWNSAYQEMGLPSLDALKSLRAFSEMMAGSIFMPPGVSDHPANLMGLMLRGREMGLAPMESLSLFWIEPKNKRICMYADNMMAVMRRKGVQFPEKSFTNERAYLKAVRPDTQEQSEAEFTIADAKLAGLANKDNWMHYPKSMLRSRVVGMIWRELCTDYGGGQIYTREEMEDLNNDSRDTGNGTTTNAPVEEFAVGRRSRKKDPTPEPSVTVVAETVVEPEPAPPAPAPKPPAPPAPPAPTPAPPVERAHALPTKEETEANLAQAAATLKQPIPIDTPPFEVQPEAPAEPTIDSRVDALRLLMPGAPKDTRAYVSSFAKLWFGVPSLNRGLNWNAPITALETAAAANSNVFHEHTAEQLYAVFPKTVSAPDEIDAFALKEKWPPRAVALAHQIASKRKQTSEEFMTWALEGVSLDFLPVAELETFLEVALVTSKAYKLLELREKIQVPLTQIVAPIRNINGKALTEMTEEELDKAIEISTRTLHRPVSAPAPVSEPLFQD